MENIDKIHIPDNSGGITAEFGRTGLRQTGGRIQEEFLRELRDKNRRIQVYTEMIDNEPLISGTYFAIKQLIKRAPWFVEPGGNKLKDRKAAEFVESCMHDMSQSWEDTLDEILSFIPYGFSVHEIVYKFRSGLNQTDPTFKSQFNDGRIGWRKLPIRAQDTIFIWLFAKDGGVAGIQQVLHNTGLINPHQQVNIPIQKLLLFRTMNYKDNPEGRSIFRASYVPYFYKKRIQNVEAIGIEREMNGLPHARIPAKLMSADASTAEQVVFNDFKDAIKNVRADDQAGLLTPSDRDEKGHLLYDFELMNAQGKRGIDTEKVLSRYNREILITVMADFLLLGHESVGSFALSSDKTRMFSTAVAGFMSQITSVFNKHAIPRLFNLNNMKVDRLPTIQHGDIETESVKEIAEAMSFFSEAGVDLNDEQTKGELLRRAGLKSTPTIIRPEKTKEPN
ncbi:hypothetical protein LCGC14_1054580 [marine sediment metagenome]|uniref:Portal protein n=1 Tax=marine sediment metagenome TaxID=412755 RepID=A0A0F9Q5W3_9ZZZZ